MSAPFKKLDDTIAAISTPGGVGGIGIVRLSGPGALSIADQVFQAAIGKSPSQFKTHTVHYGNVVKRGEAGDEIIDEALLTVMRAPKSYTREDVVELNCHGGIVPLKATLALVLTHGARLAEPGEFTKRAFLNGRIDLTQAEAVLDIIRAKTDAFLRVSAHQLKGELTVELESIREKLMNTYVDLEAVVNFPEEDIDVQGKNKALQNIQQSRERVQVLLETSEQGRILREGIKVVICGKPNVGKSSLLNVLLKQPRAIVTDVEGTTRDTIEETTQIQGIPFQLVDTAGILSPRDLIEEEAVKRSHLYIQSADLVLLMLDGNQNLASADKEVIEKVKEKNTLLLINKCDLPIKIDEKETEALLPNRKIIYISALEKRGLDKLGRAIIENVLHGKSIDTHGVLVNNMRHIDALRNCAAVLTKGVSLLTQGVSLEFISEELKIAVNALDSITGRDIDLDLLDKIFSEFCVGK